MTAIGYTYFYAEIERLTRERDQALDALRRLHDAAEVYSADQAYAPHPHIAAVQPVEPADGVALNEALAESARVLGIEADSPMWPESRSASACANAACQGREAYPAPAGSASLVKQPPRDVSELYHELLYAVAHKFPGESRHETALRYIRDTEERASATGSCKPNSAICLKEAGKGEG